MQQQRRRLITSIERVIEGPMIFLGFVWLVLLIIELIWGIGPVLEWISLIIWGIFILDFLIKLLVAPARGVYLRKNWLTAISLIIPALRLFRILRVIRLLRGWRVIRVVASLNRSMRSLAATMQRRGFGYVMALTVLVTFGGAAGMYGIEKGNPGFENYGMALWWTAMRVITAGSDFWPLTAEGRVLAFVLSLFGYAVFGYVTATLATFFIGRDAEEQDAPMASSRDTRELKQLLESLHRKIDDIAKPPG